MKLLIGSLALALIVGTVPSEALSLHIGKRRCLPRATDWPIVRPHVKESHKPGNKAKHPPVCSLGVVAPSIASA
ncbi:MAG: hypothetical protein DMF80_17350 [Acidobacteria bacterium]|nr:MAG: hypothetical protein DMF80_17350 [Acidobacteriota bacterium]PYQ21147.1 MAG: hypothetical protein DMF81_16290 [Acidobacteriota bacterium]